MSTGDKFKPPRKKPSIFWWLGGALVILLLVFFFQLLGPSPRIVASKQTTRITSSLGADGLPDFEKYMLERMRDGVTPENNAASLIWPAIWPAELDSDHYAEVAAELGLAGEPSESESLKPLAKQLDMIVAKQVSKLSNPRNTDDQSAGAMPSDEQSLLGNYRDVLLQKLEDQVTTRPWTAAQNPELANWISENERPLNQIVEGSKRTRCYFPSPTLLDQKPDMLISILLPGLQAARLAGRGLSVRAMWHAGEHRPQEAWDDLIAMHRIGHLVAQDQSIVGELVGISISESACNLTPTMLHECLPPPELARKILSDLNVLPQFDQMVDNMDNLERLSFVTSALEISRGAMKAEEFDIDERVNYFHRFNVNWNAVLSSGNNWYDRFVAALKITNPSARLGALSTLEDEISRLATDDSSATALTAAVLNPSARSRFVASQLISVFFPAVQAGVAAEDRANLQLELTRVAAALAVHRSEHGSYPRSLDELVPAVLAKLPVDIYGIPFEYRRMGEGYLLYSWGLNGRDDGGSNEMYSVVQGEPFDSVDDTASAAATAKMPKDADDVAIRVPRPPVQLPKPPSATEQ